MPSIDPIPILFVTANPDGPEPLATDMEARRIGDALWNSLNRQRFALYTLPAARIGDLAVHLRRHSPRILHIALHGTDEGLLFNDPEDWQEQLLAGEELAAIVAAYQAAAAERLRLVVLAGCGTEAAAWLLSAHIDCAIGTADDISDPAVLRFSPAFYAALGDGRSVGNAFDAAVAEVRGHGWQKDAVLLRLLTRPGFDAHSLRLDTPTHRPSFDRLRRRPEFIEGTSLSDAHQDYLRGWFGKQWATVKLADISPRQEQIRLLDVYVPLPVDFKLDIEVKEHRIVDWWVHRENPEIRRGGLQPPDAPDEFAPDPREIETAKERTWADLGVGEAELQKIIDGIQATIDERKEKDRKTKDGTHVWFMEAHDAASVQPRFVLLGEPGGGKSSFLRHLTLCLAGELRRQAGDPDVPEKARKETLRDWLLDAYTPIFIELRALVASHFPALTDNTRLPDADDFWKYVKADLSSAGPAGFETELRTLCDNGDAILLLDGLDEIPDAGDERRREQVKAFVAALCARHPRLRMIVTTRPHAYRRGESALDGFGRAELEPLLLSRLYELAQALFRVVTPAADGDEAADFIKAVEATPHIEKDLHRNPLFFTLLAALWLASPSDNRRLPVTRADLYRQAVDLLLGRWTRRRTPEPSVAESLGILEPEHLRPVLESLACAVNEQRNPEQDATSFPVENLLGILFRADFQTGLHDVPDYLTQHAGIPISPEPGEFVFVHRSFQEHLAACELTHPQPEKRIPPVSADRHFPAGLLQRVLERPELWENVARLAADELLAQGRRDELTRLLVEMARPYYREKAKPATAFLALSIAHRLALLADELDEFDPRHHLRQTALRVLTDIERFEPEQRLMAGQLLGSHPGLDSRPGVGVVGARYIVPLRDILILPPSDGGQAARTRPAGRLVEQQPQQRRRRCPQQEHTRRTPQWPVSIISKASLACCPPPIRTIWKSTSPTCARRRTSAAAADSTGLSGR